MVSVFPMLCCYNLKNEAPFFAICIPNQFSTENRGAAEQDGIAAITAPYDGGWQDLEAPRRGKVAHHTAYHFISQEWCCTLFGTQHASLILSLDVALWQLNVFEDASLFCWCAERSDTRKHKDRLTKLARDYRMNLRDPDPVLEEASGKEAAEAAFPAMDVRTPTENWMKLTDAPAKWTFQKEQQGLSSKNSLLRGFCYYFFWPVCWIPKSVLPFQSPDKKAAPLITSNGWFVAGFLGEYHLLFLNSGLHIWVARKVGIKWSYILLSHNHGSEK